MLLAARRGTQRDHSGKSSRFPSLCPIGIKYISVASGANVGQFNVFFLNTAGP